MKIYLCGAHSCGKTTVAKYVSDKYKLPMITEVARTILSEKEWQVDTLRYDLTMADTYQKEIFYRQIEEEKKYPAFVSDRSALDALTYSAQHTRVFSELMSSHALHPYLDGLRAPDSILFFVRPSKATLKADGVREAINWDSIVAIDAMVKLLLQMWNLRYFQISTDNMQERARLVDNILSLY
jgi:nicotinamide riboside kinase